MIIMEIKIKSDSSQEEDLYNILDHLLIEIGKQRGCQYLHFTKDVRDENRLFIISAWNGWESLKSHFASGCFSLFTKTMRTLNFETRIQLIAVGYSLELDLSDEMRQENVLGLRSEMGELQKITGTRRHSLSN